MHEKRFVNFQNGCCRPLALLLIPTLLGAQDVNPSWKTATKIKAVTLEANKLRVETEGAAPKYRVFDLQEPPKTVIEMTQTWVPPTIVGEKESSDETSLYYKKVRVAQFTKEPEPVARIVIDMEQKTPYTVSEANGTITLAFLENEIKGNDTQLTLKHTAGANATAPAKASAIERKDLLKDLPPNPIDLNLRDLEISAVLNMLIAKLEELSGDKINLLLGRDVTGAVTLKLDAVPFNEAWSTVLSMKGLVATQTGSNIIKITGEATYLAERQQAVTFTKVFTLNYAKAADMKTSLDAIRQLEGRKGNTIVNDDINALIVTDTEDGLVQVAQLIKELDIRPLAVSIETKLVDLRLDNSVDYGIQWEYAKSWDNSSPVGPITDKSNLGRTNPNAATPVGSGLASVPSGIGAGSRGTGVTLPQALLPITSGISFGRVTNSSFLTATLSLAEAKGNLKVLSNPRVVTLNNQTASIQVGSEIPVLQTTISPGVGTTQSVTYKNIGILLKVKPTVNPDRYIRIYVNPVVSQIGTTGGITGIAPGIDTRTTETTIITKDGDTIVIGGLISERTDRTTTKVPLLGDIPILGWLFKRASDSHARTELLVFVTPRIMDN